MDFDDDSGLDTSFADKNEPIISFSPDRCRYDLSLISGSTNDTASILSFANPSNNTIDPGIIVTGTNTSITTSSTIVTPLPPPSAGGGSSGGIGTTTTRSLSQTNSIGNTDLHRRLEKRIARANSTSNNSPWTGKGGGGGGGGGSMTTTPLESQNGKENQSRIDHGISICSETPSKINNNSCSSSSQVTTSRSTQEVIGSPPNNTTTSLVNLNALQQIPNCSSVPAGPTSTSSSSSGFDGKKVPTLLPPQRLAIPNKSHHSNLSSANEGSSSEHKPLVQWESDESEEELSFFPAPRSRGILNENLSIDNMSLSGEEDDLHLSPPPRPLSQRCPCDPRLLFDSSISNVSSVSSSATSSSPKHCCIS